MPIEQVEELEDAKTVDPAEKVAEEPVKEGNETDNKEENEEEEKPSYFIDEVNKMHGFEEQIPYEEGVDPDSAPGLYQRDKYLQKVAVEGFVENIKESYPDAYRLLLHLEKGGSITDFDKIETFPVFEDIKDNLDSQKSVFKQSLKDKGITDEDEIEAMLGVVIKKEKLASTVENYLKDKNSEKASSIETLEKELAQSKAKEKEAYDTLDAVLGDIYGTNTFDFLRIPDKKVEQSFTTFANSIEYVRGENAFMYVQPITKDNIKKLAELDYILNNPDAFKKPASDVKKTQAATIRDKQKVAETQAKNVSVDNSERIRLSDSFNKR